MKRLILIFSVLLVSLSVTLAQELATDIYSTTNSNLPTVGSSLEVTVNISDFPTSVRYIEVVLDYDPAVLVYDEVINLQDPEVSPYLNVTTSSGQIVINYNKSGFFYFDVFDGKLFDIKFDFLGDNSSLTFNSDSKYRVASVISITEFVHGSVGDYIISGGAWNTAANWNANVVPTTYMDAFVAVGAETTIDAAAVANNVTVQVGGELSLNSTLDAGGDFLVKSDDNGSGSFINNGTLTVTGTSSVQCYVTEDDWHGISSPVIGETFAAMYLGASPDVWVHEYDVTTNTYTPILDTTTVMGDMKGWLTFIDETFDGGQTFTFTGDFRTGTIGNAGNMVNNGTNNGHNFVGNPFSSAIDWDAGSGWAKTDLNNAIYVYNNIGWASYINGTGVNGGSQYIAMSQGFFVQATNNVVGTLTMDEDVCVHHAVDYLKSTTVEQSVIRLELSDAASVDEAVIRFIEGATTEYDGNFDAHKLFSFDEKYPQIYSIDNEFMAINSLSDTEEKNPIAMDVRGTNGNSMTITLTEANDFEKIYLKDEYTLDIVDLKKDSYTFTYDAEITDRFTILFGITGIDDPISDLNTKVFVTRNSIQVNMDSFENANISVYNLLGQVVAGSFVNSNITRIPMTKSGYYLVKVSDGESVITQKVFIK